MIYLDHAATSLEKPPQVARAMVRALRRCGNPGRGGHKPSMEAAATVFDCRVLAARLFDCREDQVVFTSGCTQGLNMAIASVVKPGDVVVISGFEHNAVLRPLHALGVTLRVAGRKLFDPANTLREFEKALDGAHAAVFTHASNVFGYILPLEAMAAACRARKIPFVVDAAQSAGSEMLSFSALGADFVAMPGHKGLLGPQGTGILLCGQPGIPLIYGGTGNHSKAPTMPPELPERLEAGTVNVPGIAGLGEGLRWLLRRGVERIGRQEASAAAFCGKALEAMGVRVFRGPSQGGTLSFQTKKDPEEVARVLAGRGIALRAGLHCAPLAHESAGTLDTGTVRVSFSPFTGREEAEIFLSAMKLSGVM